MVGMKHFFDLPVYRLAREIYYQQRAEYVEGVLAPKNSTQTEELCIRDHLERSYGGIWEFNEIIGYIRLYFLGTQVRGEYFSVSKKRVVRTRTKTFEYQAWKLAPEVDIPHPFTQETILCSIREYINACKKELPKRYIDTSMFEAIAVNVSWLSVFRSK